MHGHGLRHNDAIPISIECGQCGAFLVADIYELDSWIVGLGWADITWQDVKIEHVCNPQPAERSQILLNVNDGPGAVEEAIKVLS
jgi:hypothetical protein